MYGTIKQIKQKIKRIQWSDQCHHCEVNQINSTIKETLGEQASVFFEITNVKTTNNNKKKQYNKIIYLYAERI